METTYTKMSSQLPVDFVAMQDRYVCSEDIECKYSFKKYKVREGDRIAIFRLGWKSLKNYVLFEWAMENTGTVVHSVIFSKYDLPSKSSENDDLYQFCYISGENVIQGISTPFQIYSRIEETTNILTDNSINYKLQLSEKQEEILKLKQENEMLRESLKALIGQTSTHKCCNDDIAELKEITTKLKNAILGQQKEIDALKIEMKKDKNTIKNLMLKKIIAEKKIEAICSKNEEESITRLPNFELGKIPSFPTFPLEKCD